MLRREEGVQLRVEALYPHSSECMNKVCCGRLVEEVPLCARIGVDGLKPDSDRGIATAVLLVVHAELDGEPAACDARGGGLFARGGR